MTRFLNDDGLPFHALLEPVRDAVRNALALARTALPQVFDRRRKPPVEKL